MGFFDKISKKDSGENLGLKRMNEEQLDLPPIPKDLETFEPKKIENGKTHNSPANEKQLGSYQFRKEQEQSASDVLKNQNQSSSQQPSLAPENTKLYSENLEEVSNPLRSISNQELNKDNEGMIETNFNSTEPEDINAQLSVNQEDSFNSQLGTLDSNENADLSSLDYLEQKSPDYMESSETQVLGGKEAYANPSYDNLGTPGRNTQVSEFRPFTKDEIANTERRAQVDVDETIMPEEKVLNKETFLRDEYQTMKKMGYNYIGFSSFRKIAVLINSFPTDLRIIEDVSKKQIEVNKDLDEAYFDLEEKLADLEKDLISLDKNIFA